ncbi:hypothetical protein E0Z10_g3845 [Xylaria hypoxylon]|uniref:Uncharacterized protein n=1 Tax=Xylaria hypoxylon TaxID=37992 RepID=A0A4Z0Z0C3_9PEZI|nr:hypothetical protein E0Z10_g3845 [Xylaria hypoxylon]
MGNPTDWMHKVPAAHDNQQQQQSHPHYPGMAHRAVTAVQLSGPLSRSSRPVQLGGRRIADEVAYTRDDPVTVLSGSGPAD